MLPSVNLFDRRRAGVLLHLTSLPGPFEIGVLGEDARKWVDWLSECGFSIWQTLPLGPVDQTLSPYSMRSADAGNPQLIDVGQIPTSSSWAPTHTEILDAKAWEHRRRLLETTWDRFSMTASQDDRDDFLGYARKEHAWLQPFALYEALKSRFGQKPWWEWPEPFRRCDPDTLQVARRDEEYRISETMFEQYLFHKQWRDLKRYANRRGVYVFGDMPVYVDLDSVDVWWRREFFQVDASGHAAAVSGVPPDYFAEEGQLWGHPIYHWDQMRADGYQWFVNRVRHQLTRFDLLRIDHFRALESYWEIPGDATSAKSGRWAPGPGAPLLESLASASMISSLVAEDLGMITDSVRQLRDTFHLPGMLVLQFAFDGSADNPFLPENHTQHAVVYTGTHDNNTTLGWYESLPSSVQEDVCRHLGVEAGRILTALMETACQSPADMAILPMQDLLELGSTHRMNTPGTTDGNWRWRFRWKDLPDGLTRSCQELTRASGRWTESDSADMPQR